MAELPIRYKNEITFDGDVYQLVYHPNWLGVDMIDLLEFRASWGWYRSYFTWLDHTHDQQAVLKAATEFLEQNKYSIRKKRKAAGERRKPA